LTYICVSIHAPAKGATGGDGFTAEMVLFQSTRPRRARLPLMMRQSLTMCFNPRAREGRDLGLPLRGRPVLVSIHAPAKGATHGPQLRLSRQHVSIHAPAKGATATEGSYHMDKAVSIHAPAKGATPIS